MAILAIFYLYNEERNCVVYHANDLLSILYYFKKVILHILSPELVCKNVQFWPFLAAAFVFVLSLAAADCC